jgi:transcriptional regulator with XRE-family HTH domain
MFSEEIISNIRKIMRDSNLTQAAAAEYMGTSESQFSKILNGNVRLSLLQLENFARNLSMREIDVITYPKVYVEKGRPDEEPVEAILQIRLKKDVREKVLKTVFGEGNSLV